MTHGLTAASAAQARLEQRISFDVPFSALFLVALHGFSAFKIIAILYINYSIAKKLPREYLPAATWIFNVGILFANELSKGYSYASVFAVFLPAPPVSEKQELSRNFGHTLDSYGGLIPRWEVLFNFTVLRLISFNLDYYWSLNARAGSPVEVRTRITPPPVKLMTSRRSSWIRRTYPRGTVSRFQLGLETSPSVTTLRTPCTRPYILRVRS